MRTLFEIIESAKDGNKPAHDECYWAMLALDALGTFDSMALHRLGYGKPSKLRTPKWEADESLQRHKAALKQDPKVYVGPRNDPQSEEFQRMRMVSKKILDKVTHAQ